MFEDTTGFRASSLEEAQQLNRIADSYSKYTAEAKHCGLAVYLCVGTLLAIAVGFVWAHALSLVAP